MKYLLIILLFFTQACSKNSYPTFDYNKSSNPWIDAFKDRVFFSALEEAYKSDTTIFESIRKKDALNPYDGLSLSEMKQADSIGKALIKNIPPPKMCEGCEGDMNYYMATSLHYYNSRELDSIARSLYKEHIRYDMEIFGIKK
ncbi:hypothetical protein [Paracoccus sp. (in: a-proteobacteria)]|uniref:hypothetical protein n=1 Tax=Paracoccus sp. TaxID=267 RepID=UPI002B003AE0|nr:hypothetical protein [Paracoccus sp. (in: a-proteobacteria)]